MGYVILGWVGWAIDSYQRQALVEQLQRLSDHLLDDVGLRRDQLDEMLLPPPTPPAPREKAVARLATRPSLQGCG